MIDTILVAGMILSGLFLAWELWKSIAIFFEK